VTRKPVTRSALYDVRASAALLLLASGALRRLPTPVGSMEFMGDSFSAEHPKSVAVTFAISDAVTATDAT